MTIASKLTNKQHFRKTLTILIQPIGEKIRERREKRKKREEERLGYHWSGSKSTN
jgi:hypothetical protein